MAPLPGRDRADGICGKRPNMTYMELSTVPIYMDEFVGACFIPHTDTSMFPTVMEEVQNR